LPLRPRKPGSKTGAERSRRAGAAAKAVAASRKALKARKTVDRLAATDAEFSEGSSKPSLENVRNRLADGRAAGRAALERARTRTREAVRREPAGAPTKGSLHLSLLRTPSVPIAVDAMPREIRVATYNVHRWSGVNGRGKPDAARAAFVISELDADVVALQEVLRPLTGEDPLEMLSDALGLHLAFAVTRQHKRGQLGNAILSRYPISGLSVLDISHSRIERRGALCARFSSTPGAPGLAIIATHLSLVDRTRHRQVQSLLDHPELASGAAVLLGDMNAWRKCKASRELDETLERHHNRAWPASFPAPRPVLALDRIYARGADVIDVQTHTSAASKRASDHLPVVARVALKDKNLADAT